MQPYLNYITSQNISDIPFNYIIKHLNCTKCLYECSYPLFNKDENPPNMKPIFISYNILILNIKLNNMRFSNRETSSKNRLCFVEFNNFILMNNPEKKLTKKSKIGPSPKNQNLTRQAINSLLYLFFHGFYPWQYRFVHVWQRARLRNN